MKTKRIVTVLVLVLLMALCAVLTACGSDPIEVGANPGAHEHADTPTTDTPGDSDEEEGESICLHKNSELKDKKAATCLAQGYTGDTVCSDCGKVLAAGSVTPLGECDFEDTSILQEATCDMIGIKLCTCKVCFKTRNESIKVLGHQIVREDALEDVERGVSHDTFHVEKCTRENCDYEITVAHTGRTYSYPATCELPAYDEGTCPVCRVKYRIYKTDSTALGHDFAEDGWEQTTAPTCQTEGEETRICTRDGCNEVETRPVPVDPEAHEWVLDTEHADYVEATCQNPGNDTFKCTHENCEATKQEPVTAPAPDPEPVE